jgi:hypothetical protein
MIHFNKNMFVKAEYCMGVTKQCPGFCDNHKELLVNMRSDIESYRKKAVQSLFKMNTFNTAWSVWRDEIHAIGSSGCLDLVKLGNNLSAIFTSTGQAGRGQGELSGGGAAWEALVCWYLNLCLVGTNTVVVKQKKELVPEVVSDSLTVMYGNFPSNTEADLVGITFPITEYTDEVDSMESWNKLCLANFEELEVCVIQCKTNWNDNAQIPMLWDMIYSSVGFTSRTAVGRNGYSIKNLKKFTYAFVTVPSNKRATYKIDSTSVLRVNALSGGNYWGKATEVGVASNVSELVNKNFTTSTQALKKCWPQNYLANMRVDPTIYDYFKLL